MVESKLPQNTIRRIYEKIPTFLVPRENMFSDGTKEETVRSSPKFRPV
jgi:hypothetical protein